MFKPFFCSGHFPHGLAGASVALGLVLLLTGCEEKSAIPSAPPRPVRTVQVMAPTLPQTLGLTGEIHAHEETDLAFRLDGHIQQRLADVGQTVKPGEVLALLDASDSENQYRSAQAALQEARSAEQLAQVNYRRMALLVPQGAIARIQLDQARTDLETTQAKCKSAGADLNLAKDKLSYTRLVSPVAGVITAVSANAGQVVSAGQTVMQIAAQGGKDAVFHLPESLLSAVRHDGRITLTLPDNSAPAVTGQLRDISPQADTETRTWRVRFTLDTPPDTLALGTTVIGHLASTAAPVIALPASALARKDNQPAVFVVNPHTLTLHLQPVTLSQYTADELFVSQGLRQGDRVVTAGVSLLREGEKVSLEDGE